jgi:bacterioferritin-associated ferredoxin
MYVCLCKALTEADVALAARDCLQTGAIELEDVIEVLGLHCEEACGYCLEHPETIQSIVEDEVEANGFERAHTEASI